MTSVSKVLPYVRHNVKSATVCTFMLFLAFFIYKDFNMPVMVKDQFSILFIHIPKCGGSSLEQNMAEHGWKEILSVRGINSKQLKFLRCAPQHMHFELLNEVVRLESFDRVITLVREPLSRLKSEYAFQLSQEITDLQPEEWIEHVFDEYSKDPFVYDNHIRPQNEFLTEQSLIFKLEDNGVNKALETIYSSFPSRKKLKYTLKSFLQLKKNTKLKETTKTSAIHNAFNKQSIIIQQFYEKDYDVLDYKKL